MNRKEELLSYLIRDGTDKELVEKLVDEVVFLENEIDKLKEFPFLRVRPQHPELQKATPAARQYKEFLQQYINCVKALSSMTKKSDDSEESPLRAWVKKHQEGV